MEPQAPAEPWDGITHPRTRSGKRFLKDVIIDLGLAEPARERPHAGHLLIEQYVGQVLQTRLAGAPGKLPTALACGLTWAILWISGKNSGEAARLWIFLIPWGIWLGAVGLPQPTAVPPTGKISSELWGLWGLQLLGCVLVVTRVVGFEVP